MAKESREFRQKIVLEDFDTCNKWKDYLPNCDVSYADVRISDEIRQYADRHFKYNIAGLTYASVMVFPITLDAELYREVYLSSCYYGVYEENFDFEGVTYNAIISYGD